jgi:hypothetical protein
MNVKRPKRAWYIYFWATTFALAACYSSADAQAQPPTPANLSPAPVTAGPPQMSLPDIPAAPLSTLPDYPACRDDYLTLHGRVAQASMIFACITRLDAFNREHLRPYSERIGSYRRKLHQIWDEVNGSEDYTHTQRVDFYQRVLPEFDKTAEDGTYLNQYHVLYARYESDRIYLRSLYCTLIVCRPAG